MMVIQGTVAGVTGVSIVPADRCLWQFTASTTGGYELTNARFFAGDSAIAGAAITNPVLGQIGKTGRFVPFTN